MLLIIVFFARRPGDSSSADCDQQLFESAGAQPEFVGRFRDGDAFAHDPRPDAIGSPELRASIVHSFPPETTRLENLSAAGAISRNCSTVCPAFLFACLKCERRFINACITAAISLCQLTGQPLIRSLCPRDAAENAAPRWIR